MLQNADFRLIWYVGTMGEFGRRMELLEERMDELDGPSGEVQELVEHIRTPAG